MSGPAAFWKVPRRCLRLSLNLTLPLLLLPMVCGLVPRLVNGREKGLSGTRDPHLEISGVKLWLLRPFQGIGLALLLAARLLVLLQDYAGAPLAASAVLPAGRFLLGRFLAVVSLGILVSLLPGLVWALDDMAVRYRNDRTGEVRMVGKYLGVILPVGFGFYGLFTILADLPFVTALATVFHMVVTLYPPFSTLAVVHALFVRRYGAHLLKCLRVGQTAPGQQGV
uniref:Uncharacterized protein n=1 Tax=Desulfobacca acetoxidans TaxID=60893 RepID=A0A7V4G878_9BACT